MHDNTLAATLTRLGVDIELIPVYTPIRTDEENVSVDRVFFGGVNVYLQQRFPIFRYLPPLMDRILDQPWLLGWVTGRSAAVDPRFLGTLTLSMLRGERGHQRKEIRRLCRYLESAERPDLLVLTNVLIAGCLPEVKRILGVPVLVTLQGDDVFLDYLPEPHRSQAHAEIRRLVEHVDGFLVHSQYYLEHMAVYLGIPREKFRMVPLGIETRDFGAPASELPPRPPRPPCIGYLARLAPEKGLHVLVDAFLELRQKPGMETSQLRIAGWLGESHRPYAEAQFAKLRAAGATDVFRYAGELDRRGKIEFLRQLDVLSVPTTYREPKGLFVLEALAAGVPVVEPRHGAFPELLESTGGGCLVPPDDPAALAEVLHRLLTDEEQRQGYARAGQMAVHQRRNAETMARATLEVFRTTHGTYTTHGTHGRTTQSEALLGEMPYRELPSGRATPASLPESSRDGVGSRE
jgi:glycosyltransferase involved in cell wall biosynthesis